MEQIMEMLKAMQEKAEVNQAKAEADQEVLKGITEANTKSMQEDIKTGQAEISCIVGAFQEKLDTCVASRGMIRKRQCPSKK
jgi:ketopantoate reductase